MKKLFIAVAALAIGLSANAQQALFGGPSVESPVINEDGTVTFRFQAPKAIKVEVTGDFLPTVKQEVEFGGNKMTFDAPGVGVLKEGKGGVWEYTTPFVVAPDMYNYTFRVDGVSQIDPHNMSAATSMPFTRFRTAPCPRFGILLLPPALTVV